MTAPQPGDPAPKTDGPLVLDIDDSDPVVLQPATDPGDPPAADRDDLEHDQADALDGVTVEED